MGYTPVPQYPMHTSGVCAEELLLQALSCSLAPHGSSTRIALLADPLPLRLGRTPETLGSRQVRLKI